MQKIGQWQIRECFRGSSCADAGRKNGAPRSVEKK
jgi:hypothetical protein